jgi:hypothetical protein
MNASQEESSGLIIKKAEMLLAIIVFMLQLQLLDHLLDHFKLSP